CCLGHRRGHSGRRRRRGHVRLDSGQQTQACYASRKSARHGERHRQKLRKRLNGLYRVGELVCDEQRNVAEQIRYRLGRVRWKFREISSQSLEYLKVAVYPPAQLVRVAAVIVDDSAIVAPAVAAVCVLDDWRRIGLRR